MCDLPHLTTNCFINGKPHVLNLTITKMSLSLTLTNKNTFEKWKCTPSVEYVESMTRKTGNFKTFSVFADMMRAVFLNASSSLTMKLFTQNELEKLNDFNLRVPLPETAARKRIYFILVYTSEFDRIHYPLPMDYLGPPNPEILQATIHGLERDKVDLIKELEKCKVKSEASRQLEMNSLKKCLADTGNQCGELSQKCSNVLEEFICLKRRIDEELGRLKMEVIEMKRECDGKIGQLASEVKNVVSVLQSMDKFFVPPKRNWSQNRGDAPSKRPPGRLSDSSVDKSTSGRLSVRRSPLTGRPPSPRSVCSYGSIRAPSSSSSAGKNSKGNFKPANGALRKNFLPDFRDSEVKNVRLQIEALQRAVLGLSDNFKNKN